MHLLNRIGSHLRSYYFTHRYKNYLPFLVISVGQACNLKCKNCGNFAPYAPANHKRYDLWKILECIETIIHAVGYIGGVQIQGGEPFLYSDLNKLLLSLGQNPRVGSICIATNGSFNGYNKAVLSTIKKYRIGVRISDYKIEGYENAQKEFANTLNHAGIRYAYYEFTGDDSFWLFCGDQNTKKETGDSIVEERFRNCAFNDCYTLENGILVRCSRAYNATFVQKFALQERDFIDILHESNLKERLPQYLKQPEFMEACRYCYGTSGEKCRAGEQITEG